MSAVFSHGITIFINWALLKWGGAVEQAMFGIAWQMNTVICMIFSPFADLSKREFAVIHNDDELLSKRFIQSSKIIIWMTSYFAIFVGVLSKWIVLLCFGEKYKEAYLVTLLIMLYTVHQSWGQMGLCFLHATEKTRICAILAFGSQLITLLCVFAFQIPNGLFEKGLGAIGIALTYIIPNLISVNVMYLYICKTKNISFLKLEFNSLISIALCSSLAMIMYNVFGRLNVGEGRIGYFVKIFGSGIVYTIVICICVLKYPHLLGLDRGVILGYFGKILKRKEL
jgi:O-antigen/teichoic acid export membrane protein